jgi:hypothetical protein
MTVSPLEALDLLKKWMTESSPILGSFENGAVVFKLSGFIAGVYPHGFVIAHYKDQEKTKPTAEMTLILLDASNYEYQDLREAPPEMKRKLEGFMEGFLAFDLPTSKVILYQFKGRE